MAYVGLTNQLIAQGGAADLLYVTYAALTSASWNTLASGTGAAGGYSSSGSLITSAATFNSNGAWVRMREPGGAGGREYVMMRGSTATSAIIKYSRSTGFGSGSPAAAQAPTTGGSGDGQVILGSGTDATAIIPASGSAFCGGTGYVQGVASTTAVNGTYGFWSFQYASGSGTIGGILMTEGVAAGSTDSTDGDPSWRLHDTTAFFWGTTQAKVSFWQKYNLGGSSYITGGAFGFYGTLGNTSAITRVVPATLGQDPYASKVGFYPLLICKAATFPKGFSSGIAVGTTTQNQLDVFNFSSAEPRIAINTIDGTATPNNFPLIVIPWVPSVVPTV